MKAFDLKAVQAGAKVCTRNGRKVRILCTDLQNSDKPVCAALQTKSSDGEPYEYVLQYYEDGFLSHRMKVDKNEIILDPRPEDLMIED